jgi:hypothetical protein
VCFRLKILCCLCFGFFEVVLFVFVFILPQFVVYALSSSFELFGFLILIFLVGGGNLASV